MTDTPEWLWYVHEPEQKLTYGRWARHLGQKKYVLADLALKVKPSELCADLRNRGYLVPLSVIRECLE